MLDRVEATRRGSTHVSVLLYSLMAGPQLREAVQSC